MGYSSVEEYKKTKKVTVPVETPRGVSTAHRIQTNFVRADNLPDVFIHAKCQIDWYKIVPLANGWSFLLQHCYGGRH